ncbi:MAG: PASTA domain-containing protein [Spirochaetia bacterium]|nr:PASTA domain-containing protein [Spirochaetia bacterium]
MEYDTNPYSTPPKPSVHLKPENRGLNYLTSLLRLFIFWFGGLSIFFIFGFIIVKFRVADKTDIQTPALIGSMYLDVHNQITEDGFRVEVEKVHSSEYPTGYIIAQNISPGEIVKEGARLILLVNQGKALIETPNLTGISENLVDGLLKNIPVAGINYSLQKGTVTYIPDSTPKGEILSQNPPAGTPVIPDYPVSFLISSGREALSANFQLNQINLKGLDVHIAQKIAFLRKIPMQIETKRITNPELHGKIISYNIEEIEKTFSKNIKYKWMVTIGRYAYTDENKDYPFRVRWIDPENEDLNEGLYTIARTKHVFDKDYILSTIKKENDDVTEDSEPEAFIKVGLNPFPVFYRPGEKLIFYEGYYSGKFASNKKQIEPAKEPAAIIQLQGAKI